MIQTATHAPAAVAAWRSRITGHADVPPTDLVRNPANWRVHPRSQQRALAGALSEIGWVAGVIVNTTTGHVVDGHLRIELAIARGEPTLPVTYVEVSEEEERVVLVSPDPIGALARGDEDKLAELLAAVTVNDEDLRRLLQDLGASASRGLVDPDALPAVPANEELYVKPGDLWQLGPHKLLCGNATDPAAVSRLLDGAAPTLLVSDPPYGVQLDPTWRDGLYNSLGKAERPYMVRERKKGHRNTTVSGDTRVDWSEAFELVPSIQVGYVWHAGVYAAEVAEGLKRIGFEIASQVIWDKGLFAMSRGWFHWGHEPCWVVRRPGVSNLFIGGRDQSTVWRAPSPKMIMAGSKEAKQDHPAQKPVLLYETAIRNHLEPGGLLYDCFLGSGTAIVAATNLACVCYAMEIEPRYVQQSIERWQAFTGEQAARVE